MKTSFTRRLSQVRIAILDLSQYTDEGIDGYMINRINVPREFRGQGIGSALLNECISCADADGVTLYLGIMPSDGLHFDALESWYKRYGFVDMGENFWVRESCGVRPLKQRILP